MTPPLIVQDQWSDLLARRYDPYALAKYEILLEWIGNLSGKSVLVAGCGSGEFCVYLSQRGASVDAIDVDERYVELARQTASRFGVPVNFWLASIEAIPVGKKYDYVVATDVIEHIEDDRAAVEKMRLLVKDNGVLVLTVPALNFLMGIHDESLGHFRRYRKKTLRTVLAGRFSIVRMRYFGFFLIPVTLLLSRLLRRPYPVTETGQAMEANTIAGKFIGGIFEIEKRMDFKVGTSLLLIASPK